MQKSEIDKIFRENDKVFVKFKKVDGSIRDMICTTKMDSIPIEYHPKSDGKSKGEVPTLKNVFDLEVAGWRRFKYEFVIECKPED